jgi:hypothetical protein
MGWTKTKFEELKTKYTAAVGNNQEEGIEEDKTAATAAQSTANEAKTKSETALERVVPSGGSTGQVLEKESNTSYKTKWGTVAGIPSGGSAGESLVRKGTTETEWKEITGGTSSSALKIGLNGLPHFYSSFETALGLKRTRENIGAGPGSARTQAYGNEGIGFTETFLKKGEGRTCLPIYVPRITGEVEIYTRLTHAEIKEDMENICKWAKKLNEEIGYSGISEIEYLNESYFAYIKLFSPKEYAEGYAVAHKVCKEYGFILLANAWGDTEQYEKRLETELTAKAAKGTKLVELASVTGMPASGTIVLEEEPLSYSKIESKKVTLTSETAVAHEKSIAKSVFATTTESQSFSDAEYGGGWCYLICKHLSEISEAPSIPDAWSFHPYGPIYIRGTGNKGWLTTFVLMDILREQGIYAPMHVTEMGNAITGEGGVAGPELSELGVKEALINYLRDCETHGVVDFIGFYKNAPEKTSIQEVFKNAVISGVKSSYEDSFGIEEVEIGAGGVNFRTSLRSIPRMILVDLYGESKAKYILYTEEGFEASDLYLKLFKYETATVPKEVSTGTKVKIIWYAKK